ncbi:LCP family protein [Clostridium fallax]|uniref:Transcriptional attenuator, LytR family n=1 Tax=Clostridium fallax TaxID=1533 RepID=A0A1M4V9N2_9CLOT|nr:LCP family protein [Clostridium fallax]SHE65701.1 transcriptional attenuator, LytR family [Clostridium fallax]SQB05824.1 cell envelope-related transcriptional attenuator [Clostridium fallax]
MSIKGENHINEKNNKREKRNHKKKNKVRFVIMIITLLLIFASMGVVAFFYNYTGKFSKNYSGESGSNKGLKEPVRILLAGLDIGDPKHKENHNIKRTDTLMVVKFDPKNNKLAIVSIPRDTLIKVKNKNHKINEAYAIGGDKTLKTAVQEIIDAPIDYIVKIDYDGFRSFIDAIGGIEMHIDRNMYYDDPGQDLHINFKKGETVLLDGKKAEEFFRWRKNNDGTGLSDGDLGRIKNQQVFISKVVEKCTSPAIILKAKNILDILPKYIETNMSPERIISYGMALTSIKSENIKMYTMSGDLKTINHASYVVYNKSYNKEALDALKDEDENIVEVKDKRKTARIKILNATKIQGLAAECEKTLKEKGYENIQIGNYKESKNSEIQVSDKGLKKLILDDITIKKTEKLPMDEKDSDIIIILGKDYKKFGE